MITNSFEVDVNFWQVNPQLKLVGPFKDLYNSDKSQGKGTSSRKMWAIALYSDRKSKYFNLSEEEKEELIFDDYYGDRKWPIENRELFDSLCFFYNKLTETSAMRTLREIEQKLEERSRFLKNTEYTLGEKGDKGWLWDTADTLDKMLANSQKLYDMYDKTRKIVEQEMEQGKAIGKQSLSASDEGAI